MMKSYLFAAICLTIFGCAKEDTGTTTSVVSGTLSRASFPSDPSQVTATNEQGASIAVAPDARGAFQLALQKGHTYTLAIVLSGGTEPLVFPRSSGALDRSFRVSSGAAVVDLGAVHHLDSAPAAGFSVKSLLQTTASDPASTSNGDGECIDGMDATTGLACIDDQGAMSCEGGHDAKDNHADGECENGVDATTGAACTDAPEADNHADGECESGVDATTGAACTDAPEADPAGPMAIAEHNAPGDVGGCDDSGDEEGND